MAETPWTPPSPRSSRAAAARSPWSPRATRFITVSASGCGAPMRTRSLCVPHASAFSLAAARRLGWALQDTGTVTLHGRALNGIVRYLQPGARILALGWHDLPCSRACSPSAAWARATSPCWNAWAARAERVRSAEADAFALDEIDALNTIAVQIVSDAQSAVIPLSPGLDDTVYEHDGQLASARSARFLCHRSRHAPASCCGTSVSAPAPSPSNGCCAILRCAPSASSSVPIAPPTPRATPLRSGRQTSPSLRGARRRPEWCLPLTPFSSAAV